MQTLFLTGIRLLMMFQRKTKPQKDELKHLESQNHYTLNLFKYVCFSSSYVSMHSAPLQGCCLAPGNGVYTVQRKTEPGDFSDTKKM